MGDVGVVEVVEGAFLEEGGGHDGVPDWEVGRVVVGGVGAVGRGVGEVVGKVGGGGWGVGGLVQVGIWIVVGV